MTTTLAALQLHIGRCKIKGCKFTVRVDADQLDRDAADTFAHIVTRGGPWEPLPGEIRCSEHSRIVLRWERVYGTFNATKACTARCESATGPDCECYCGGENHGGRYSV